MAGGWDSSVITQADIDAVTKPANSPVITAADISAVTAPRDSSVITQADIDAVTKPAQPSSVEPLSGPTGPPHQRAVVSQSVPGYPVEGSALEPPAPPPPSYQQMVDQQKQEMQATPWPTHLGWDPQGGFLQNISHNIAAPVLYEAKQAGELLSPLDRWLNSLPGVAPTVDALGKGYQNTTYGQPGNAPPVQVQPGVQVDPTSGKTLPPSAQFVGPQVPPAPPSQVDLARQQAEQELYSDPRSTETYLQTALRNVPALGQLFDPRNEMLSEHIGRATNEPLLGFLAGLPLAAGPLEVGKLGKAFGEATKFGDLAEAFSHGLDSTAADLGRQAASPELAQALEAQRLAPPPPTAAPVVPEISPEARFAQAQAAQDAEKATQEERYQQDLAAQEREKATQQAKYEASLRLQEQEQAVRGLPNEDQQVAFLREQHAAEQAAADRRAEFERNEAADTAARAARQAEFERLQQPPQEEPANAPSPLPTEVPRLASAPEALPEQPVPNAGMGPRDGQAPAAPGEAPTPEPQVKTPEGVQYSGDVQQNAPLQPGTGFNPTKKATPAPAPEFIPGGDSPNASTVLDGPIPKSPSTVVRDLHETLNRLSRGEFSPVKTAIREVKELFTGPDSGPRLTYGEGDMPKGAAGSFQPVRDLVQVVKAGGSPDVPYHEIGHAVAAKTDLIKTAPTGALDELEKLGDPNTVIPRVPGTGTSWKEGMGIPYKRGEGFAEFVRLWMQDPDVVHQLAPEMAEHWNSFLDSSGQVGKRLCQAQADTQAYNNADELRKAISRSTSETLRRQLEAKSSRDGLITRLRDYLYPVKKMRDEVRAAGGNILPEDDPYQGLTTHKDLAANETVDALVRLKGILKPIHEGPNPKQTDLEFWQYAQAQRADELHGRGFTPSAENLSPAELNQELDAYKAAGKGAQTGYTHAGTQEILQRLHKPEFDEALRKLYAWNDEQLQMLNRAGNLSDARLKAIRAENQRYVPFHRLYELAAGELGSEEANSMERLTGSERDILDPLASLVKNTMTTHLLAARNVARRTLLKLWDDKAPNIGRFMKEIGPDSPELKENTIRVLDGNNGVRHLQVTPELWRAVTDAQKIDPNSFFSGYNNVLNAFLRPLATQYNPSFMWRNVVRDAFAVTLNSRVGGTTNVIGFPFMEGLLHQVLGRTDLSENSANILKTWETSGGAQNFAARYLDRLGAEDMARGLRPQTLGQKMVGAVKSGFATAADISEQSTRIGHYLAARRYLKALHPEWSEASLHAQAAFEARDVLDFSRRGSSAKVQALRAAVPFIGAGTEGVARAFEAMKENPKRFATMGALYGAAPAALTQYQNWNNPDYWQIPQRVRDSSLMVKRPGWKPGDDPKNEFFPVPVERGPGAIFHQATGWVGQALKGHQEGQAPGAPSPGSLSPLGIANTVIGDVTPGNLDFSSPDKFSASLASLAGTFPKLASEIGSNKDFFTGRDIVPEAISRKNPNPQEQYDQSTSVLARMIGMATAAVAHPGESGRVGGVSPMIIDHVLKGVFAGTGQMVQSQIIDPALSAGTGIAQGSRMKESNVRDALGMGYNPYQFESVNLFKQELDSLRERSNVGAQAQKKVGPRTDQMATFQAAQDQAKARKESLTPEEQRKLQQMEVVDKHLPALFQQLRVEKDPQEVARLQRTLREKTSQFTPAPGGQP